MAREPELIALLGPAKVLTSATDLARYASDASPYRLLPRAVVVAEDAADVGAVLRFAREHRRSVVFRAAGTSLNGQAQGDDILIDVRRHWSAIDVLDDGSRVRLGPGTILARANAALARHGRVLGPDPASAAACTIGGVVANNACGMSAGITRTAYRTLAAATIVLPSGTVVDTAAPDADAALAAAEPDLVAGLLAVRDGLQADPALGRRIRAKHRIKNTSGYRLDAFLDETSPVGILRKLIVGSQGTLGFVAEATLDTFPLLPKSSTGLVLFPSLATACDAVAAFAGAGAFAVELMDHHTLRSAAQIDPVGRWAGIAAGTTALLVEFRAADETALGGMEERCQRILADLGPGHAPLAEHRAEHHAEHLAFSRDKAHAARLWKIRKAFVASVGGARPPGTTLITEDFAVAPERLAGACETLTGIQERHGFQAAVAGHAIAGNLHFLLAFDAARPADVARYGAFMDEFCHTMVEHFDASLKAEHGTGRNMAPFLELEWGAEAVAMMRRVKDLLDPDGVLGPGVVLSDDPGIHLRDLKTMPVLGTAADPCIECGFCEPVCPSRDLTATPRQRIVLLRELARDDAPRRPELAASFAYTGVDTCAGDGGCALACPVGIDTGVLMKEERHRSHSPRRERLAAVSARLFSWVERTARLGLRSAGLVRRIVGDRTLTATTRLAARIAGAGRVPQWISEIPAPAPPLPATDRSNAAAVYFPACVNRIFGPPPGFRSLPEALVALSTRAGAPLWIPDDVSGLCCSTIWQSKGYRAGTEQMANRMVEAAWRWTDGGRLPLVIDAASCTLGLGREAVPHLSAANAERHRALMIVDAVDWCHDRLLPELTVVTKVGSAAVHPTCSTGRLALDAKLRALAEAFAIEVEVPDAAGCCGFAGDRGLLRPELTAAATREEAAELAGREFESFVSANRMCEIGLSAATGQSYASVVQWLDRATEKT